MSALNHLRQTALPRLRENRFLAAATIIALLASVGFWWGNARTKVYHLKLGAGGELKYHSERM